MRPKEKQALPWCWMLWCVVLSAAVFDLSVLMLADYSAAEKPQPLCPQLVWVSLSTCLLSIFTMRPERSSGSFRWYFYSNNNLGACGGPGQGQDDLHCPSGSNLLQSSNKENTNSLHTNSCLTSFLRVFYFPFKSICWGTKNSFHPPYRLKTQTE